MIKAPLTCMTLNKLQKVWWSDVKTSIQTNKKQLRNLIQKCIEDKLLDFGINLSGEIATVSCL